MKICGYSERGVLNSLFYEIRYNANSDKLLAQFVDEATFPFTENKPSSGKATVFVEQSLSDFGDADAIIHIESDNTNCAIFVEAKVQAHANDWKLSEQFSNFENGTKSPFMVDGFSSNLFTQIYYKQQFVKNDIDELKQGIPFPKWSFSKKAQQNEKTTRKIGENKVVLNAATQIKNHCDKCENKIFYLMLVPDNEERVKEFFHETLQKAKLPEVPGWNTSHFGYLTWAKVKSFCEQSNLIDTLDTFTRNGTQIYRKT